MTTHLVVSFCLLSVLIISVTSFDFDINPARWPIFDRKDKDKPKEMLIVDADFCADDSLGLMVLETMGNFKFMAITVVFGNVGLDITGPNALRTVNFLKLNTQVYLGAAGPIEPPYTIAPPFELFGDDAVGGASKTYKTGNVQYNTTLKAHEAMVKLVNQYPGQITVAAFGPLTNLALAQELDPSFLSKVKKVFIMGGNIFGRGNAFHDRPSAGEFNFAMDPKAAQIVLVKNPKLTEVYPWETCMWYGIPWDAYDAAMKFPTKYGRILKEFSQVGANAFRSLGQDAFQICDLMAAFAFVNSQVVTKYEKFNATVETEGIYTNGMMVLQKVKNDKDNKVLTLNDISQQKQVEMLFKFVSMR